MGIYIKGMEMPRDCPNCKLAHWDLVDGFSGCNAVPGKKYAMVTEPGYSETNFRPLWCPLIDVPPHGRLINANALLARAKELSGPMTGDGWDNLGVYSLIEGATTIIPAGEEEGL